MLDVVATGTLPVMPSVTDGLFLRMAMRCSYAAKAKGQEPAFLRQLSSAQRG